MDMVEEFEAARPRLLSLAHRIVGSVHDAEDAVQAAWVRTQCATFAEVDNPDGWFTTVTARICLDQLRKRHRGGGIEMLVDEIPEAQLAADEAFIRRDEVSRALLVVLSELTPKQRVAYVLHDLFAVPFEQIAMVLDMKPVSAKKLASRARIRVCGAGPPDLAVSGHAEIVEAFLAAARGGDLGRLVALLAPGAIRVADPRVLPDGSSSVVRGATAVAEETRTFLDRIETAATAVIAGRPGAIIAPGGHPFAAIHFHVQDGLIASIEITAYEPGVTTVIESG